MADLPRLHDEIARTAERIAPHILRTPLLQTPHIDGMDVHLKLESEQHTGSFKARGALNRLLSLTAEERERGVLTASTGNHAQGFARALAIAGGNGLICLPENADPGKVAALRRYGVELAFHGTDCLATELYAKQRAAESGMTWVSPYNDPAVIAGQGTVGKEILEDLPEVDAILATVGGGGLISGIASWVKAERPGVELIGCLPENAPEMYLSVQRGEHVALDDPPDTLSDGSAGGFEPGSITFDLCRELVDRYVLVSEAEIADAIRWMVRHHHKIIEGAAGVALAACVKERERLAGKTVAVVICGANIAYEKLQKIL
jgi:threonine dehydratase